MPRKNQHGRVAILHQGVLRGIVRTPTSIKKLGKCSVEYYRTEGESSRDGAGPDLLLVPANAPVFMQFTRNRASVL